MGGVTNDVGMDELIRLDRVLTARQLRVPLPTAATADEMLTLARAQGYERRDLAALHEVLAQLASGAVGSLA